MNKMAVLVIVGCSLALFGCATTRVGKVIDDLKVEQVKEGITTESELNSLLGNPQGKGVTENGKVVYQYVYAEIQQKWAGSDVKQDTVMILIGSDGKVEKVVKNKGVTPIRIN